MRRKKVYFGTGLASATEESLGFGFEFLGMVLTALVLMRDTKADGIFHDIATIGYNISDKQRCRLIKQQHYIINQMIKNLHLKEVYKFKFSHCYHGCDCFTDILSEVETKTKVFWNLPNFEKYGRYTVFQIAQMKYIYETEDAAIKLGWTIATKTIPEKVSQDDATNIINQGHLNEYYFDMLYKFVFPDDNLAYIYAHAGMDIITGKRYAPYTVTKLQNRPLLTQNIKSYIESIPDCYNKRRTLKHYENTIVHNWENFFGEIEEQSLTDKLQYIQNKVFGID